MMLTVTLSMLTTLQNHALLLPLLLVVVVLLLLQIFDEYDDEVAAAEEAEEQGAKPDQAKVGLGAPTRHGDLVVGLVGPWLGDEGVCSLCFVGPWLGNEGVYSLHVGCWGSLEEQEAKPDQAKVSCSGLWLDRDVWFGGGGGRTSINRWSCWT
jgi:hypothetical protein